MSNSSLKQEYLFYKRVVKKIHTKTQKHRLVSPQKTLYIYSSVCFKVRS